MNISIHELSDVKALNLLYFWELHTDNNKWAALCAMAQKYPWHTTCRAENGWNSWWWSWCWRWWWWWGGGWWWWLNWRQKTFPLKIDETDDDNGDKCKNQPSLKNSITFTFFACSIFRMANLHMADFYCYSNIQICSQFWNSLLDLFALDLFWYLDYFAYFVSSCSVLLLVLKGLVV